MWGRRAGSATACLASLSVTQTWKARHTEYKCPRCVWVPKLKHKDLHVCFHVHTHNTACASVSVYVFMCANRADGICTRHKCTAMHLCHSTLVCTTAPRHVCVCLPATMQHLPLREEHWLLGHSSGFQIDLPTSSARGPRDATWIRESR